MSALTILLLGMLAMTSVWLGWGFLAAGRREADKRLDSGPDRTSTLLFDRWAGQ